MMYSKISLYFGLFLIVIGALALVGTLLQIDLGAYFCPTVMIILGIGIINRARKGTLFLPDYVIPFGSFNRHDFSAVSNKEYWMGIGEFSVDLSEAVMPEGETQLKVIAFVCDMKIWLPEAAGLMITSNAIVNETKIFGEKETNIFMPLEYTSPGYAQAQRKLRIDCLCFVNDLKIRRP